MFDGECVSVVSADRYKVFHLGTIDTAGRGNPVDRFTTEG